MKLKSIQRKPRSIDARLLHAAERHEVIFSDYGLSEYDTFLRAKGVPEFELILDEDSGLVKGLSVPARYAHMVDNGQERVVNSDWLPMPEFLYRDQCEILKLALAAERFACWSDCGLGKTLIEFEFARQVAAKTGGRVLIITLNDLVPDLVREAAKFYGDGLSIEILGSRAEMREWCATEGSGIAITNYDKMNPDGGPETQVVSEMKHLAGLVLDESSRLKTGGGKQKWALIKSSKGIRYKLSCTATPAPNEVMEFASQASFLERIRGESDVIWTYFVRDPQTQEWTVKAHARPHFFRWMASWSIYVQNLDVYGWTRVDSEGRKIEPVPEPEFFQHRITATEEQIALAARVAAEEAPKNKRNGKNRKNEELFASPASLGMVGRGVLNQAAKGFVYDDAEGRGYKAIASNKPAIVAELVESEMRSGLQVLVWCVFDAEVDLLMTELRRRGVPAVSLGGSDKKAERPGIIADFRDGRVPVLVSKASMLGFGFNFQFCGSMVFSGFTDSFESFYQAVRRAFRFGQRRRLRVHLPFVPELEEAILRNVLWKADQFAELIREQQHAYVTAMRELAEKQCAVVNELEAEGVA